MAITVKHNKVSTIPDTDDTSLVRPSDWNADHTLVGLGTMAEQNANNVSITGGTVSNSTLTSDTVSNNLNFTPTTAPAYTEGRVWYDSSAKAVAYYNDSTGIKVHIGQDLIVKVINNTGSTIANGAPVYITSTSSGQTYPNVALAKADVAATSAVIGLTNGSIANGAIGYVTSQGGIDNVNTGTFTVGQVLYLSPYSAGQLMNTIPPTGITVQVGVVTYVDSSAGRIYVKQTTPLAVPASIITGQVAVANGGTGASTASGARTNLGLGTIATQDASAVAITGGTINGTTIGATTASTGRFSDLTDTGLTSGRVVYASTGGNLVDASNFTYDGTNLVAGAIQNTPIGATTPSTVNATTITGQTGVLRGTGSNLILRSQAWATSPWFNTGLTSITNNTSDVTDPLGGNTATKIVATGSSSAVGQSITLATTTQTASVYLRTLSGTATCDLIVYLGASPFTNIGTLNVTVTSSWQRFSVVTSTATAASYNLQVNNISASTIYGWGAQLEIGSTLRDYVATTTTAVYGTPTLSFSGVSTIGLQSDGSLYVSPAGTGALQAQATTSTTAGGNARGANAVDWQTNRGNAINVANGQASVISGGSSNTSSSFYSTVGGGVFNTANGAYSVISGGLANTASGIYSGIVSGNTNTASGYYGFVGNGFTNSTTSNSAVTTQSGTMNATTAVTLSGSNASIKVGQYITGTSISGDTYVAAISGTALTLSKVASGSSTSTLSFFTPHGVVVGGGNNQATGSYSFIGGGGDAGTSANRNVASGDWSFVGGGAKNVASGIGAVVVGGGFDGTLTGNTASGAVSFIGGGRSNTASNFGASVLGGYNNISNGIGSSIYGGDYGTTRGINGIATTSASESPFGTYVTGQSQTSILVLGRQTTDATATVLRSDPSAVSTTNQVILPNNSAYFFRGEVISGVTGGGNTKGWTIEGVIKRGANAASTALVGTPTVTSSFADAGASTWTIAVTADTTNGGLRVTFTGQASTTIRTVCQIRTTEMTY